MCSRAGIDVVVKWKNSCPFREWIPAPPVRCLVTILTERRYVTTITFPSLGFILKLSSIYA